MLRRHGPPLAIKDRPSDQHLRFEMGKGSIEFVRRAYGIEGRASGDRRSREKTERRLRPVRLEKRYAIVLAKPDGTERVGVPLDFSPQPAHTSGMDVQGPTRRLPQDYDRRDQRLDAAWHPQRTP